MSLSEAEWSAWKRRQVPYDESARHPYTAATLTPKLQTHDVHSHTHTPPQNAQAHATRLASHQRPTSAPTPQHTTRMSVHTSNHKLVTWKGKRTSPIHPHTQAHTPGRSSTTNTTPPHSPNAHHRDHTTPHRAQTTFPSSLGTTHIRTSTPHHTTPHSPMITPSHAPLNGGIIAGDPLQTSFYNRGVNACLSGVFVDDGTRVRCPACASINADRCLYCLRSKSSTTPRMHLSKFAVLAMEAFPHVSKKELVKVKTFIGV